MLCTLWYRRVTYQDLCSQSTFMGAGDRLLAPVPFCSLHFPPWVTSMAIQSSSPLCPLSPSAAGSRPHLSKYQMQVLKNKSDASGFCQAGGVHHELQRTLFAYFLCWLLRFCWRFKSSGGHYIFRVRCGSCCLWSEMHGFGEQN